VRERGGNAAFPPGHPSIVMITPVFYALLRYLLQ
jgi:hypothetical protein